MSGGVVGQDLNCPLQLTFEAREGEWVVVRWVETKTASSNLHLKRGRNGQWWVKTKTTPSDSHLKRGRGNGQWCGGSRLKTPPPTRV